MELRYFVILQEDSTPIFAQSYNFDSKESCITFDNKISDLNSNQLKSVINDYFKIIRRISNAQIMNEDLYLFDIGLSSYRMTGITYNNYFFIGIFDNISQTDSLAVDTVKLLLRSLAIHFFNKYSKEIETKQFPNFETFSSFKEDIVKICYNTTRSPINTAKCRNCLEECNQSNNKCIPHLIFFDTLENCNTGESIKFETESHLSINNTKKF